MPISRFAFRCWFFLLLCLGFGQAATSQSFAPQPWQPAVTPIASYALNPSLLDPVLTSALSRWENGKVEQGVQVKLPLPDFTQKTYRIWRSPQMAPTLAARYPEIQTYFGQAVEDPRQTVYLLQTGPSCKLFYFDQSGLLYRLETVSGTPDTYHFTFPADDGTATELRQACRTEEADPEESLREEHLGEARRGETRLFRYRLALACTGEYGSYHGGTKASVMAAMNELLLQTNAIYERELSIHFDLVANNDQLIFLDSLTDPYDNNEVADLLESNKMVCNYTIGYPNYDLGHVLATKFGGQAQIGSVCNFSRKAQAFSGLPKPEGYYMTAIFAHELGHQMGAQHTQSGDCNRNLSTALEPGSGSTLMAYAGICAPNVTDLPDSYFHGNSLELIQRKAGQGVIFGCSAGIRTENLPPSAEAGPDIYVPVGMSFALRGNGTDPNGDSLSFLWEQIDALVPEDNGGISGPIFRSRPPAAVPIRRIGQSGDPWEALPTAARKVSFRLTVRDHYLGLGSNDHDDMNVYFIDSIGPLSVVSPNLATDTWTVDSTYTIRWSVGDTDQAPVDCQTVDIYLSTDGGSSYQQLLAAGVPNSGSALVSVPAAPAEACRIRISCAGGYLFDDSDHTFAIIAPQTDKDTTAVEATDPAPVDTLQQPGMDSLNNPADTLPDSPVDTVPDMPMDTTQQPIVDSLDSPADTMPGSPVDTVPDMPADTMQQMASDTLDSPVDTLPESPVDTVPDMPVDTIVQPDADTLEPPPGDTLPEMPADTTAYSPQDTLPQPPPADTATIGMPVDPAGGPESPDTTGSSPQDAPIISTTGEPADCRLCQANISIWPNPTAGLAYLRIVLSKPERTTIQLFSPNGQILETRKLHLGAGVHTLDWSLATLPAGIYRFRISAGQQSWTKPLIRH